MEKLIQEKLRQIEREENCCILFACEAGSRALGLASHDSDYDVRFVYARPVEEYLKLERSKDVLEFSITEKLDIVGWDIDKTLRLIHKSNIGAFEWFSSPVVYRSTPFAKQLKSVMPKYFSPKSGLWHYLSMAKNDYAKYFDVDIVRAKKYLTVFRSLLCCRWILDRRSPPIASFTELAESYLPNYLAEDVERLLDLKMNHPEIKLIPAIDTVNQYIVDSLFDIQNQIETLPGGNHLGWDELNRLFLSELGIESYYEIETTDIQK